MYHPYQQPLPLFFEFFLSNLLSNLPSNVLQSKSVIAYCIFEQTANVCRKDYCCFTAIWLHSPYAGSIHTDYGNCWHACTDPGNPGRPDNCTHTAVYPHVGNFWWPPYLLIRTQILQISICRGKHDTKGSQNVACMMQDDCMQDD